MRRKGKRRFQKKIILIVVEGETEQRYFEGYRTILGKNSSYVIDIKKKRDTNIEGLLDTCIWESTHSLNTKAGDRIFCVCDYPGKVSEAIDKKIVEANNKGTTLIITRPCVELWFLLHFVKVYKPYNSSEIVRELRKHMPNYRKADKNIHSKVHSKTNDALKNADSIYSSDHKSMMNPSTSMRDIITFLHRIISGGRP